MPQLALQPDSGNGYVWVTLDSQKLVPLREDDSEGLKIVTTTLVASGVCDAEAAASIQGVTVRTVEIRAATYIETGDSADLIDHRRFNPGQQTDYRMTPYKPALIRQAILNVLQGRENTERGLAAQLGDVIDDRTAGRHLHAMGWRAAEEAGLPEEVAAYLDAERTEAYLAGVAGEPLESVLNREPPPAWQKPDRGRAGIALGILHLVHNGAYESLKRLVEGSLDVLTHWPAMQVWHILFVYLLGSGGGRLSWAKHFPWKEVRGLLKGGRGLSATSLRNWIIAVAQQAAEHVIVRRPDGSEEQITRLQDYQEEAIAQRARSGLIEGRAIYLDDYVNAVFRREPIARTKHGTRYGICKAFRRHMTQDVDTGHIITCPLGRSDITPLAVLRRVVEIINGGLGRVVPGWEVILVIADRWWSVKSVICWALEKGLQVLTWGKDIKTLREALAEVSEEELERHPVTIQIMDEERGELTEQIIGYRLDTELNLYDLQTPIRCVVEWDGQPGSRKYARLVVGAKVEDMDEETVVDGLRFRQRVEIVLKQLQRRLNWSAFGGGEARLHVETPDQPDEEERQRLLRNRRQVATRLENDRARLAEATAELERLRAGESAANGLKLGVRDLKKLVKALNRHIQRATDRLAELDSWLAWAEGRGPQPEGEVVAELDLTRESILTQMKLDVFTAQETLVDDFIEHALKPVLWEEAEQQAAERKRRDARSTAQGREGEPLSTDVEELYRIKMANLERETILRQLSNQRGEFVRHKTKPLMLVVFDRFEDRRMQAAYERYCVILNQRDIRVPLDDGEPWRLLFTYHLEDTSSSARFK